MRAPRSGASGVAIDGVTGRELDTALGTVVWFTRSGVDFTLLGSVPPVAAEAARAGSPREPAAGGRPRPVEAVRSDPGGSTTSS